MGAFTLAYSSEIINKKSVTFTATLFALLFRRLDISLASCSPAELGYVSTQYTNIKKQCDTVYFTFPMEQPNYFIHETIFYSFMFDFLIEQAHFLNKKSCSVSMMS